MANGRPLDATSVTPHITTVATRARCLTSLRLPQSGQAQQKSTARPPRDAALGRSVVVTDDRDDDLAVFGGLGRADDREVAVVDAGPGHRVAVDGLELLQSCVVVASVLQHGQAVCNGTPVAVGDATPCLVARLETRWCTWTASTTGPTEARRRLTSGRLCSVSSLRGQAGHRRKLRLDDADSCHRRHARRHPVTHSWATVREKRAGIGMYRTVLNCVSRSSLETKAG